MFFYDACPCQYNLLECSLGWQTTPLNLGFAQPRRHSYSNHLLGLLWPNLISSFTNTDSHNNALLIFKLLNVLGLGPWSNTYINTYYWAYHPYGLIIKDKRVETWTFLLKLYQEVFKWITRLLPFSHLFSATKVLVAHLFKPYPLIQLK